MERRASRVARYSAITAASGGLIVLLGIWLTPLSIDPAIGIPLGLVAGAPFGMLVAAANDDGETAARKDQVRQGRAAVSEEGEDRKAARRRGSDDGEV